MKVVRLSALRTGRLNPPSPPGNISWYSFLLEAEWNPGQDLDTQINYEKIKSWEGLLHSAQKFFLFSSAVRKTKGKSYVVFYFL
jgi:hypothetical protein